MIKCKGQINNVQNINKTESSDARTMMKLCYTKQTGTQIFLSDHSTFEKNQFKCIIYADESLSRNDMMHMFTRMHTDLCEELYHIIWLLKSHVRHKTGKKMRDCHGYDSHLYIAQCKMHLQHLQKLYHNNLSFWNVLISISCHLHSPFWTMTVQLTKYSLWHLWFKINFPVLDTT